jgi:hypothetical protein
MALYDFYMQHGITVMSLIFAGMLITKTELSATFFTDARSHMQQLTGLDPTLKR